MDPTVRILPLDASLSVTDAVRAFLQEPYLLLLDSSGSIRANDCRYSFLTAAPVETFQLDRVSYGDQPFQVMRDWQKLLPWPDRSDLPPFIGGIAGLLSYELGHAFERLPEARQDLFQTPVIVAGLYDWALVWDHIAETVNAYVVSLNGRRAGESVDRANWILDRISAVQTSPEPDQPKSRRAPVKSVPPDVSSGSQYTGRHDITPGFGVRSEFSRESYLSAVARVIEYIRAGDIFQANLSQRLVASWDDSAFELYQQLRRVNPAPFSAFLQTPEFSVLSASPERFLRVKQGTLVETRPIKGTRRRHQSPIADLYTSDELSASEKDRAENVMIVDLLRNDLSRVCCPGSVRVTGVCEVEVFQTVQHLVSTVVGELQDGCDIWDLFAATIPGGSVTGAPKIRAMEIITELERVPRGAYCGNLFYVGPQGDLDSSILIRTFTLNDGLVQFPVGGGIVSDSVPAEEYEETLHKAAGLLRAIQVGVVRERSAE
ncbi:MAG: aminodeoxychorismate synthase component I [Planctomycetaceae bacterium]|nr:aminodeoxychorismate synthase component I [Planctomycetaceae bacterium]